MKSDESLSDWESVNTEFERRSGAAQEDSGSDTSASGVLVELPPGGISLSDPGQQSETSSIASSFVRNLGNMEISYNTARDAYRSTSPNGDGGSTTSSFVTVPREASARFSSDSSAASSSYWSESNASAYASQRNISSQSSTSSLSSVISNFDVISLSSGQTRLKCKRCKTHNEVDARFCSNCWLALVANPNPEMDEQLALRLQSKEEENATRLRLEHERKRSRLSSEGIPEQAYFFAEEINSNLYRYKMGMFLPYNDLKGQILSFIMSLQMETKLAGIRVGYVCTHADPKTLNHIKRSGFRSARGLSFKNSVYQSITEAWKNSVSDHEHGGTLYPISEYGEEKTPSLRGWVVVYGVPSDTPMDSAITHVNTNLIIPVLHFDACNRDHAQLGKLVNELRRISLDFVSDIEVKFDGEDLVPDRKRLRSSQAIEAPTDPLEKFLNERIGDFMAAPTSATSVDNTMAVAVASSMNLTDPLEPTPLEAMSRENHEGAVKKEIFDSLRGALLETTEDNITQYLNDLNMVDLQTLLINLGTPSDTVYMCARGTVIEFIQEASTARGITREQLVLLTNISIGQTEAAP